MRLLSAAGCEAVFEEQSNGTDLVLGVPLRFGMGFGLSGSSCRSGRRTCFWGGWGGSIIVIDLDKRLTVAYVMNRMESGLVGDIRGFSVVRRRRRGSGLSGDAVEFSAMPGAAPACVPRGQHAWP